MRELTKLEIEEFDFSGHIPELNTPVLRKTSTVSAKTSKRQYKLKTPALAKPARGKRRARFGFA